MLIRIKDYYNLIWKQIYECTINNFIFMIKTFEEATNIY